MNLESLLISDRAANYKPNTKRRIGVSHARIKKHADRKLKQHVPVQSKA